jgi:hypothetical protein
VGGVGLQDGTKVIVGKPGEEKPDAEDKKEKPAAGAKKEAK